MNKINKEISIVIPCYNEEDSILQSIENLKKITDSLTNYIFSYLLIDDGSTDKTYEIIKNISIKNKQIKCIKLSRNFGSHVAISAGFDYSDKYDAAILITADLTEPPEMIEQLINSWEKGNETVWTVRKTRNQSFLKKILSKLFYKVFIKFSILKNYPKDGPAAFWLIDKKILVNWYKFKETNRMVNGLISWMGFKQSVLYYDQKERLHGKSSFTFISLIKLAIDSFVSFSFFPIRLITYLGITISLFSFIYAIYIIFQKITLGIILPGYTSLMVVILILGGIQLITLGVLGEYLWRGVDEARNRPLYLVSEKLNIED